jgi:hypothetical protein
MNETYKTNNIRPSYFAELYLKGKVIDIGAGNDPVCQSAEIFEIENGDANSITKYRNLYSYNTVYSSHCLEHMRDPVHAIAEWWGLVAHDGYMIIVVPHEDLYEQGQWPSLFNDDHKSTFRLGGGGSWSPVSFDIEKLVSSLPGSEVVSICIHSIGCDHSLLKRPGQKVVRFPILEKIIWRLEKMSGIGRRIAWTLQCVLLPFGHIIDQTKYGALCQIEVIAKKRTT